MKKQKLRLKLFLFLFILVTAQFAHAADVINDLKALVGTWNTLHNSGNPKAFENLYGKQVLFYGKYRKGRYCQSQKTRFLNRFYTQKIISPITVQFYSSGVAKCSFVKETTYKELVKRHHCYLLFKEEEGSYRITGESDLVTDEKQGVRLNLGDELPQSGNRNPAVIYFFVGLLLAGGLGYLVYRKRKKARETPGQELSHYVVPAPEVQPDRIPVPAVARLQPEHPPGTAVVSALLEEASEPITPELSSKEKGDAFEEYIISLFDIQDGPFQLVEWRSDKIAKTGVFPASSRYPDLVFSFQYGKRSYEFAIECKWRKNYQNGKIGWAQPHQIKNYLDYQRQKNIPVFVAIGLGGTPDAPEELFLAKIKEIATYPDLFPSTLKPYGRDPGSRFHYRYKERKLY